MLGAINWEIKMGKVSFPIVETKKNKLVSDDGNVGYFFRILPPDLEQYSKAKIESFFESLSDTLNTLDFSYFKFYRLDGLEYLETSKQSPPQILGVQFFTSDAPLKTFFGHEEFISDIGIYDDYIAFNGQYLRVLSILEFSERPIDETFLPADVDYVLKFRRIAKKDALAKLERIRSGHLSSFLKVKRDIASEGTYQQAEALLQELISGSESLFEMELFFIVKAFSLTELHQKTLHLCDDLLVKGVKTFIEGHSLLKAKSGLAHLFNGLIPGVRPQFNYRVHLNKTSHLRYLLSLNHSHLMPEGVAFLDTKGKAIYFNPFDQSIQNRNMLVTGASGHGKSVFVNKLVHHLIGNHPTVILDKGGSFKRLALYHGGEVLSRGINPMQFSSLLYLRELILSVVDGTQFGRLERGRLLKAIKSGLCSIRDFRGLLSFLEKEFPGISLYFEEIKDFISSDTLIPPKKILYVDVDNYPKMAIAPLIIFVLQYFKSLPGKEKILVFDECWSFLKDHASYISECFRTFRKTGAFPIAISQGVRDFEITEGGVQLCEAISANSYFKVYFPQEIKGQSDLTNDHLQKIKSLEFAKGIFSDCYLKSSDNRFQKILRNSLTPLEWELFHTDSGQDEQLLSFLKKFGTYFNSTSEVINSYVRLKHEKDNDFFIPSCDDGI